MAWFSIIPGFMVLISQFGKKRAIPAAASKPTTKPELLLRSLSGFRRPLEILCGGRILSFSFDAATTQLRAPEDPLVLHPEGRHPVIKALQLLQAIISLLLLLQRFDLPHRGHNHSTTLFMLRVIRRGYSDYGNLCEYGDTMPRPKPRS